MTRTTHKNTRKKEEQKSVPEEEETLTPLPGMDAEAVEGEEPVETEEKREEGAAVDEEAPSGAYEEEAPQEEERSGPVIYTPNLFVLMYEGEEPYEYRESLRRPYPKLRKGDVVVTDRKTAKWLTRTGMSFSIVENILTLRQDEEVKKTTFFDALKKVFG